METIERLVELFRKFPGIGPRQARRFVYFLLSQDPRLSKELEKEISELGTRVKQCDKCFRFFDSRGVKICNVCADPNLDPTILVIVEKDVDLDTLRKASNMRTRFFVLGGLVPILDKEGEKGVRFSNLVKKINEYSDVGLKEVICAFSASPAADHTIEVIKEKLAPFLSKRNIKISVLGRGLSTGTELEYSDQETIKSAFENRK